MTDEQLIRALRGLDRPVEPAQAFVTTSFDRIRRETRKRGTSPRLVLVAAALLLLAFVAGALIVGRQRTDEAPSGPLRWTLASPGPAERLSGITAFHGGFVAVGSHLDDGTPSEGRIWTSPDGSAWTSSPLPDVSRTADVGVVYTARDGSIVAIAVSAGGDFMTTTWRSTDGHRWEARPLGSLQAPDPVVAVGPAGYLLATSGDSSTPSTEVWRSTDGLDWRALDLPAIDQFTPSPTSMAVGDAGFVITLCQVEAPPGCRTAASADGVTWRTSTALPVDTRVAWFRGMWLAAAASPDGLGINVWNSDDGVTWSPAPGIDDRIGPYALPSGRSTTAHRLIVAGDWIIAKTGPSYTQSFVSNDGRTWQRSGLVETVIEDAASYEDTIVVAGNSFGGRGALWRMAH